MTKVPVLPKTKFYEGWGLLDLYIDKPDDFEFEPGHFLGVGIEGRALEPYSIACPSDKHYLRFLISIHENGDLTPYLRTLKTDDLVVIDEEPGGFFDIQKTTKSNSVYVATSVGIAPLLSLKSSHPITVVIGGTTIDEILFYLDEISNIRPEALIYSVASEVAGKHVQDILTDFIIETHEHFFLCGVPEMIADVSTRLVRAEKTWEQIETEVFV